MISKIVVCGSQVSVILPTNVTGSRSSLKI